MYKKSLDEINFDMKTEYIIKFTEISALFHDIGKANNGFQNALYEKTQTGEPTLHDYRHEIVSFYMLLNLFLNNVDLKKRDKSEKDLILDIIEKIKNKDKSLYFNNNNKIIKMIVKKSMKLFLEKDYWNEFPIINSILWLVLTHHKLIGSNYDITESKTFMFDFEQYDRTIKNPNVNKSDSLFLTFDQSKIDFLIENDFVNSLIEKFNFIYNYYDDFIESINLKKENLVSFTDSQLPSILTLVARPVLVYADYYASSEKEPHAKFDYKRNVKSFANTYINNKGKEWFADTLLVHLYKVSNTIRNSYNILMNHSKISDFCHTDMNLINEVESSNSNIPDKFKWQKDTVEELNKFQNINKGFFGVIMSGTGSGKTRACIKFMTALNNQNLRMTVALGLRTLSCQTEKEYIDEIFLNVRDIARSQVKLLVGSCLNNLDKLDEIDDIIKSKDISNNIDAIKEEDILEYEELSKNYNGSSIEALVENEEYEHLLSNDEYINLNNKILKILAKTNNDKELISKPIIIMTIDNIMKVFNQEFSDNLRYLLRIVSSDFILDEIDDYSSNDLVSISCLIYMLGYFNRKVFISSATMTPDIIKTLFDFYQQGINDNINNDKEIVYAFINENDKKIIKKDMSLKNSKIEFNQDLIDFTLTASNNIDNKSEIFLKHKIDFIDFENDLNINEAYKTLYDNILNLHNHNYVEYRKLKISVGFVKFNNVESSQDFCKYIDKLEDSNIELSWINYHSKMLNVERFYIEDFLDTHMKRKNEGKALLHSSGGSEDLFGNSHFKELIDKAIGAGKHEIVVILSTTNIIEVGRDHDYDWSIIEPSSIKSVIQAMGRVKRHRDINILRTENNEIMEGYKNILLFSKFMKEFKSDYVDYSKIMSFPGIQTDKMTNNQYNSEPIFAIKEKYSLNNEIPENFLIKASLNIDNKYSINSYERIYTDNEYIFKDKNYHSKLFDKDFLKLPSNKFLIFDKDYSLNASNINFNDSYKKFRLLEIEKFRQEFYLNSNIFNSKNISARYYIDDFNNNYISKLSFNFYRTNKFRKSTSINYTVYFTSKKEHILNIKARVLIIDKEHNHQVKMYAIKEEIVNKKKVIKKAFEVTVEKTEFKKYFFKSGGNYFNNMYDHLKEKYRLENNFKVRMSMIEFNYTEFQKPTSETKFMYSRGIGFFQIK